MWHSWPTSSISVDSLDAAGAPRRCVFFPTNLHVLTLLLHLPELDVSIPCEFWDLLEPLRLHGCVPIPGPDVLMLERSLFAVKGTCPCIVNHGICYEIRA